MSRSDNDGKVAESTESRVEMQEQVKSISSLVLNDDVSLPTNTTPAPPPAPTPPPRPNPPQKPTKRQNGKIKLPSFNYRKISDHFRPASQVSDVSNEPRADISYKLQVTSYNLQLTSYLTWV